MITIICVLRSGGSYDAEWVRKLRAGVAANLKQEHRFLCLSDVDVECLRIPMRHDWPGWWAKIELFRPGVISGPTLYMDLDTIITGPLDEFVAAQTAEFSMLENFNEPEFVGSGVMWFKDKAPAGVYERFCEGPERIIDHYNRVKHGSYRGDQAFIHDALDGKIDKIASPALRSYKRHCRNGLPEGTSIVAFHGRPRPTEVNADWIRTHWS